MRIAFLPLLLLPPLFAAKPGADRAAEDHIRAGNEAVARGQFTQAEARYAAAEELTTDPGLLSFNRGVAAFRQKNWRDAEAHFTRALDDRACPPERRVKALYNRGACLLQRGGAAELRVAIDCFDLCLSLPATDDALAADARHNLEIAKLLWNQARAKEKKRPLPNDPPELPPELPPQVEPPPQGAGTGDEQSGTEQVPVPQAPGIASETPKAAGNKAERKVAGQGTLPVNVGGAALPPRTPAEVRDLLKRDADRLAAERRALADTLSPPERPNVKDW